MSDIFSGRTNTTQPSTTLDISEVGNGMYTQLVQHEFDKAVCDKENHRFMFLDDWRQLFKISTPKPSPSLVQGRKMFWVPPTVCYGVIVFNGSIMTFGQLPNVIITYVV